MRRMATVAAVMLLGLAASGSAAVSAPAMRVRLLPAPLLPLSEADMRGTGESGCESHFVQGNDSYIFSVGTVLMLRTAPGAAGLQVCHPDQDALAAFGEGPATVSCGGRRISMRRVGRTQSHPQADSAEGDAILTMSDGTHTRTIRGGWGTAC